MIERFKKLLPNKSITSLPQFIAKAKKEECTAIVLNCVYYIDKEMAGFPNALSVGFHVSCTAYKNKKKTIQYVQHVLAYRPTGKNKKERREELMRYYGSIRPIVRKMKETIKKDFPGAIDIHPLKKH